MGIVIIPRASGKKDETENTIQLYYEENGWLENDEFRRRYKEKFGVIGADTDRTAYTKRCQNGAYYGFLEWEDIHNNQSRRRITQRGKVFWEHLQAGDMEAVHEDIMRAIEQVPFGRNNHGCPSSDSDFDPPAVFLHAALELKYVTNDELAYLLYLLDGQHKSFADAINAVKYLRQQSEKPEMPQEYQRNDDPKPIIVLREWGILEQIRVGANRPHKIADAFLQKYEQRIRALSLVNTAKAIIVSGPESVPVKSALSTVMEEYEETTVVSGDDIIADVVYQDLVDAAVPSKTEYKPEKYENSNPDGRAQKITRPATNPALGKEAIKDGGYACAVDVAHTTFVKKDGTVYMEVHHLIPLEQQVNFENKLDTKANLVPMCPLCHKLIHYGRIEDKIPILTNLFNERKDLLKQSGLDITLDELIGFYK